MNHLVVFENPEGLSVLLDRSDVGVGSKQNVLQLALLLVHFFDGLAHVGVVAALQRSFVFGHHFFD